MNSNEDQNMQDEMSTEETIEEQTEEPAAPVAFTPVVPAATIDEMIISGGAAIQDAIANLRASKVDQHDADLALMAAQARVDEVAESEGKAEAEASSAIDRQITNLNKLKTSLGLV